MTAFRLALAQRTVPQLRTGPGLALLYGAGLALLLAAVVLATTVGTATIPLSRTVRILIDALPGVRLEQTWTDAQEVILLQIRLPRVLAAALVGAALSGAGVLFQGLFRNPMADPYLLGVSSGAAFFAVAGFVLFPQLGFFFFGFSWVPVLAFVGALVTVTTVYALAQSAGRTSITTLLLAGIAVGSFLTALQSFLMLNETDGQFRLTAIFSWLLGGVGTVGWSQFALLGPFIGGGLLLARAVAYPLNALSLGEEQAGVLGVPIERTKILVVAAAALLTAAAVAAAGLVGFVGLVVPHMVRMIIGPDHRRMLWASALYGALFLVLADLVARTLLAPQEIPVGIITGVVGGPFFLVLLRRAKGAYAV